MYINVKNNNKQNKIVSKFFLWNIYFIFIGYDIYNHGKYNIRISLYIVTIYILHILLKQEIVKIKK